jgi:hypothetical protein
VVLTLAAVERNKSHQFNSRVTANRSSHACRSCSNHCRMKLEQANARAKTANKVALEAEKEKDAAEKAVEELKRQVLPSVCFSPSRVL